MAGAAAPAPEARVPIRTPDGELGTIPASQLRGALDSGAEQVAPQVLAEAEAAQARAAEYGGLSGAAAAGGLGAARGLTFGLSDVAAIGLGGDRVRETIKGYRDENPGASLAGEVAGVVAPSFFTAGTGGLASVARGASAIPRGAGALARGVERGVAGVVGEGASSLGGRMLQRGLATGAGAATEAAIFNVGQQLSEDAIEDHAHAGERLVAAAEKGALFGLLAGGVLGAGTGALERAGEGLAAYAAKRGGADGISGLLRRHAAEEAYRATGAKIKDWQLLGETSAARRARAQDIGGTLLDEGIVTAKATKGSMSEAVAARAEAEGKKLGEMVKRLDGAGASVRMSPEQFLARAEAEVLAPLARTPGLKAEEAAVRGYLDDFAAKTGVTARAKAAERAQLAAQGVPAAKLPTMPTAEEMAMPTFETMADFRKAFDKKLKWDSLPSNLFTPGATDQLRKVRAIFEDEFVQAGDKAAQVLGGTFSAEYKATKELYSKLADARRILKKEVGREEFANRAISLTDTITGIGAMAALGPGGLALAGANKLMRERGNQVAAGLLNRASGVSAIQRASSASAAKLTEGVRGALITQGVPVADRVTISPQEARRIAEDVKVFSINEAAKTERVSRFVGGDLGAHAPRVEAAALGTANRAISLLAANAPVGRTNQRTLIPSKESARYSDTDLHRFARLVEGVQGGADDLVKKFADGTIDRDTVEAVKFVYPKDFEAMRAEFQAQIAELAAAGKLTDVPYQKRLQLGTLLGVPADDSMDPAFVKAMQAAKASAPEEEQEADNAQHGNYAARPIDPNMATPYATAADRIQMGGA